MDGRELLRSMKVFGSAGGPRTARAAERARVPGLARAAEPAPGGGTIRFARSSLRLCVSAGGTVFWGWGGAGPLPSYALAGEAPEADPRACLEPDTDGGWRIVSERVTVAVSRHGAVEVRTPGGLVLRRDLPPRWWEPVDASGNGEPSGAARWVQRSEVPADARFFGLGGRPGGPRLRDGSYRLGSGSYRLRDGSYRLGNTASRKGSGPGDGPPHLAVPVQFVVSDAGTHLVFHDNPGDGRVVLAEGEEGAGSGHDRPGTGEVRMEGGPLRCWVVVGTPARVLHGWAALTGAPALPPSWALGPQHAREGSGGAAEVRRAVDEHRERGLALSAVHLGPGHQDGRRPFTVDRERFPDLPALAAELRERGVRLVATVEPTVAAEPGNPVYDGGRAVDAFVRDGRGEEVRMRGAARAGGVRRAARAGGRVLPDFTDPAVRKWWGDLYEEPLRQGFSGVAHGGSEPASPMLFGHPARRAPGGDHREADHVHGLSMARAGYEGLRRLRPDERPFVLSRSGWAGLQRYGGTWTGDVTAGWPGLRAALSLVLGLGLCGVPYSGPDMGGGDRAGGGPSPELFLRRYQLAAWLPLFRTRAGAGAGPGAPWEFGPEVLEHARVALAERERLRPYFTTLARLARMTGAPYVRPVWWGSPEDRALRDCEDAFLLGDSLLVAPVLTPGTDRRAVRLPRGRWYDTATGRAYEGPGQVLLDAPPARVPVLARAGAVLPVRDGDGGPVLEVWAPAAGRPGGGLVVRDTGDGWEPAGIERYQSRLVDGRMVVERVTDGGVEEAGLPVRVRGL